MSPRFPSHSDAMPAPEGVYQTLHEHEARLDSIDRKIDGIGESVSNTVRGAVLEIKVSNSSETRKLIAAIAGTALTILGGVFTAAKLERPATPVVIPRSALDLRLDECRRLQPGSPSREECTARAITETDH